MPITPFFVPNAHLGLFFFSAYSFWGNCPKKNWKLADLSLYF